MAEKMNKDGWESDEDDSGCSQGKVRKISKSEMSLAERIRRKEVKKMAKRLKVMGRRPSTKGGEDGGETSVVEEIVVKRKKKTNWKTLAEEAIDEEVEETDEAETRSERDTLDAMITSEDEKMVDGGEKQVVETKGDGEWTLEVREKGEETERKERLWRETGYCGDDPLMALELKEVRVQLSRDEVKDKAIEVEKLKTEEEIKEEEKTDDGDWEIGGISSRREARKMAKRMKVVIDGVVMMMDQFEDAGVEKEKIRKCRRQLEEVKGGIGQLAEAGWVNDEKVKEEGEPGPSGWKNELGPIKLELGGDEVKAVEEASKKVREQVMIDGWVAARSAVGPEDSKIQIFDCDGKWIEKDIKEGWREVMVKERYEMAELRKVRMVSKRWGKAGKATIIVALPFEMLAGVMNLKERKVEICGQTKQYDMFVEVAVCWHCQQYGHTRDNCGDDVKCRGCGGAHEVRKCTGKRYKCVTCVETGIEGVGHRANSIQCPLHRALLAKKRERMEGAFRVLREGRRVNRGLGRGRIADFDRMKPRM